MILIKYQEKNGGDYDNMQLRQMYLLFINLAWKNIKWVRNITETDIIRVKALFHLQLEM